MTQKNTKTAKQADSPKIKLDKELRELFLPHTAQENAILEESILKEGCREALVVWKETGKLVDGYHRYDICKKHKIKYKVRQVSFPSKEEAKLWMWENQKGRRNLTTLFQQIEVVLKLKDTIAAKAKERQLEGKKDLCQISDKGIHTFKILGEMTGASHDTVRKVEFILDKFSQGEISVAEINDLRIGKVKINRIYNQYKEPKPPTAAPVDNASKASASSAWRKMSDDKKHAFVSNALDSIMKDMSVDDKLQFAMIVSEWANNRMDIA